MVKLVARCTHALLFFALFVRARFVPKSSEMKTNSGARACVVSNIDR